MINTVFYSCDFQISWRTRSSSDGLVAIWSRSAELHWFAICWFGVQTLFGPPNVGNDFGIRRKQTSLWKIFNKNFWIYFFFTEIGSPTIGASWGTFASKRRGQCTIGRTKKVKIRHVTQSTKFFQNSEQNFLQKLNFIFCKNKFFATLSIQLCLQMYSIDLF